MTLDQKEGVEEAKKEFVEEIRHIIDGWHTDIERSKDGYGPYADLGNAGIAAVDIFIDGFADVFYAWLKNYKGYSE